MNFNTDRNQRVEMSLDEIRAALSSFTPSTLGAALMHGYATRLLSLLDSQAAGDAAPFCRVHAEIEKHDGLALEVGNDCVACSLHERTQLLNILEPFAAPDGSQDSLTVLQNVTERAATRMRDACVNAIKSLRAVPRGAAYNNAVIDAIHKVESVTLDQVEQEKQ